mgnify:CR=1 FL=1
MSEIWKDITGFVGLYKVSSLGNVQSLNYNRTGNIKQLKPMPNKKGYLQVLLCNGKIRRRVFVHRIVAIEFIPNDKQLSEVNHINEIKTDNRAINLEWCDTLYNNNYGTRNKRLSKAINQLTLSGELINTFEGIREAERITGIKNQSISQCCKGKYKTAGGYIWEYSL